MKPIPIYMIIISQIFHFSININLFLSQSGVDKLYHFSAGQVFGQIDKQVVKILNGLNQFYIIDRI